MVNFGERLRQLRKVKGLSQAQVADILGGTKMMVSSYETGLRYPPYPTLVKMARLYGVTTDYLLGATEKRMINVDGLSDDNVTLVHALVDALRQSNRK